MKRTTIELDEVLLARAKAALGCHTARATIEEALRRATIAAEGERAERAERQRAYLERLGARVDLAVLGSGEMWQ